MSVYDFSAKINGSREKKLSDYKGKVLLIVNTASKCGFTPQYAGLQGFYAKFKHRGFEVLAFPCDQFGHQEPGIGRRDPVVLRDELSASSSPLLRKSKSTATTRIRCSNS